MGDAIYVLVMDIDHRKFCKKCPKCKRYLEYHLDYDAYYCRHCKNWIEKEKAIKIHFDPPLIKKKLFTILRNR